MQRTKDVLLFLMWIVAAFVAAIMGERFFRPLIDRRQQKRDVELLKQSAKALAEKQLKEAALAAEKEIANVQVSDNLADDLCSLASCQGRK